MIDSFGRLDISLDLIVSVMGGHRPPDPDSKQFDDYFKLAELRLVEQFGEDALNSTAQIAGFESVADIKNRLRGI
jgi:hypothetical protein